VLEPLDPYLAHSARKPADYYESVWKTYQYEGHTYALSQTMITFFIAYNKAAFREAGLDPEQPPRTLEEFDAMAERCTRWRGGKPGGELERLGFPYGDLFTWGMAFGADYWNEPRRRLTVDTPQMVACLDWMKRNVDKYGLERVRAFKASFGNATSPNNPFITGKVAMMPVGDWYRSIIEEYAPRNFEWGWFAMPAPAGGRPNSTFLMSSMFVIPKAGRQKQEAWEFIEYMTSAEVAENIHVGDSPADLTALKESAAKPQFDEPYWHFVEGLLLSRNAMPPPKIPLFDRFISELSRVEDYVMAGARTPQAALADMQMSFQHELDLAHKTVRDRAQQAGQPAGAGLPVK
jgi:multiple sugar transport system substrate-binding protein